MADFLIARVGLELVAKVSMWLVGGMRHLFNMLGMSCRNRLPCNPFQHRLWGPFKIMIPNRRRGATFCEDLTWWKKISSISISLCLIKTSVFLHLHFVDPLAMLAVRAALQSFAKFFQPPPSPEKRPDCNDESFQVMADRTNYISAYNTTAHRSLGPC